MKLSKPQQTLFWREWSKAKAFFAGQKFTAAQIENERYQLLERAGFDSLTHVDTGKGFDLVLAELKAINAPADVNAQVRLANMERTRLAYSCDQLAQAICGPNARFWEPYIEAIMHDRWGHTRREDLSLDQLTQLRNTLAARLASKKRKSREGKVADNGKDTACRAEVGRRPVSVSQTEPF